MDQKKCNMEIIEIEIDKLVLPQFNSTENDLRKFANLKNSLRTLGQLKPIIVCENQNNTYTIVEGKKIFLALLDIGNKKVFCINTKQNPRLVNAMINTITFEIDNIGFSEMVNEMKNEIPINSLANYIPFTPEILKGYDKLHNFDWSAYDKEAESLKQVDMFNMNEDE